ncbi:helix-turn-helix domain-containing protein [Lachnospiraceae bacterium SGI.054]
MIVYYKLNDLLKKREISKRKLCEETGLSTNIVSKINKNEGFKTETINRLCEYLKVQPSEIMEWIPDKEYNETYKKKAELEAQIAELQEQLKNL